MDKAYIDTVRLLLEIAPEVFRADCFAMKGGTALNLFVQDMPRLSVDIDVVYVSHRASREEALAEIGRELATLRQRLRERGIDVGEARTVGEETKLFARRGGHEVKIEVNHVFRGTLLPTERRALAPTASSLFTTSVSVPTLAMAELYGSKLVAAMDRQHPRDFFDVHGMYNCSASGRTSWNVLWATLPGTIGRFMRCSFLGTSILHRPTRTNLTAWRGKRAPSRICKQRALGSGTTCRLG